MVCDSHVHVGYYARAGMDEPFYYSPRRVAGVLRRCGVEEYAVSSTCAQIEEIQVRDIVNEAKEVARVAGERVHQFFWLSGHLYDEDREMRWSETGLFEGIKFHEMETPWMRERREDLERVLMFAEKRRMPVMFHCPAKGCMPSDLAEVAKAHQKVRFNFAHCAPMDEMAEVIAECPNVWTDTACLLDADMAKLSDYDWKGRLMFGTDLPTWQAKERYPLMGKYRACVKAWRRLEAGSRGGIDGAAAFRGFVGVVSFGKFT